MAKEGISLFKIARLVAILLLASSALFAQQSTSSWNAIERATGQSITVVRRDNHSQTGQLEKTSGDSLTISDHDQSAVIGRDDIRQVYARTKRSRTKGALWGLAIGGGGGAITGAAIVQPCKSGSFCIVNISRGEGAAVGAAAGAAVGAIVGVLVGGGHKKVLLYERGSSVSNP